MKTAIDQVRESLTTAEAHLAGSVASPLAEAETLLRHVIGCSRSELYSGSIELTPEQTDEYNRLIRLRAGGTPLQHLTGVQSFRLIELEVRPGVLIPRPETELLVEHALFCIAGIRKPVVVDVGTGSGAVGLSIAYENPAARVLALDISATALGLAQRNADLLGLANIIFVRSDLLAEVPASFDIDLVVANPPYLTDAEISNAPLDVRGHEPTEALYGGPSGAEISLRLIDQATGRLSTGGWLVMESSPSVVPVLFDAMSAAFADVSVLRDLTGRARFIRGRRR